MAKKSRKSRADKGQETGTKRENRGSGTSQLYMYASSEIALKDAASLAFSDVLGLKEDFTHVVTDPTSPITVGTVTDDDVDGLPGIIEMRWVPSLGTCEKSADTPINVAALNAYSYVRHANSGHANYDHTDFIMVIVAVANIFAWLGSLMRLYGVISVFNQKNRYLARTLVQAMGFTYDDLVLHINDLRAFLNHKISEASVLWIPNTMPFVSRWFMMNSYVYQDAPTPKSQLYLFRMKQVYEFVNKTSTQGSMLKAVSTGNTMDFNGLVGLTNQLIRPLISDEDVGIICGDILKAFGADKIYGLSQIPDEYINLPIYDEEVLMQIHNATIWGDYAGGLGDIKQDIQSDPGYIYQDYTIVNQPANNVGFGMRRYFDLKGLEHDPAIVMIASRLTSMAAIAKGTEATYLRAIPYLMGTEVIMGAYIWHSLYGSVASPFSSFNTYMSTSNSAGVEALLRAASRLEKFDWSPIIYGINATVAGNSVSAQLTHVIGEIENFTTIGEAELNKLHRTAVYTEMGIPYI